MTNHANRQPIPLVAAGVMQPPKEPKRTAQDLLAERRANVLEQSREKDPTARAMLQFHIDQIDRELHARREADPIRECFAATRTDVAFEQSERTIEKLVAERDARDAHRVDGLDISWSPAQHARSAA